MNNPELTEQGDQSVEDDTTSGRRQDNHHTRRRRDDARRGEGHRDNAARESTSDQLVQAVQGLAAAEQQTAAKVDANAAQVQAKITALETEIQGLKKPQQAAVKSEAAVSQPNVEAATAPVTPKPITEPSFIQTVANGVRSIVKGAWDLVRSPFVLARNMWRAVFGQPKPKTA